MPRAPLLARIAPPGTRCTCLVSETGLGARSLVEHWSRVSGARCVWLEVPDGCGSVAFWALLASAAAQEVARAVGRAAPAALALDDPSRTVALLLGLRRAQAGTVGTTVVVDGYDRIDDPLIHEGMAWLVERLEGRIALVTIGRTTPPLPLKRWRAAGWLSEIHPDELTRWSVP